MDFKCNHVSQCQPAVESGWRLDVLCCYDLSVRIRTYRFLLVAGMLIVCRLLVQPNRGHVVTWRDVIGDVTIRFPIGNFLLMVLWNQASISNGFRVINGRVLNIWNHLQSSVVKAETTNMFKSILQKISDTDDEMSHSLDAIPLIDSGGWASSWGGLNWWLS